ncbi:MAG: antibiotic biosynthesis monooxygenase [Gammaproteobacteria bacterium]|nr:antibiotic biosynthesis monooxygenase [Gammaproteobacteria bacterium]
MSQQVRVIITADTVPAHSEAVRTVLARLADDSRREQGCLHYELLRDNVNPQRFTIVEAWSDAAALAKHRQAAHVATALAALQDKLAGAPDIRELTKVG